MFQNQILSIDFIKILIWLFFFCSLSLSIWFNYYPKKYHFKSTCLFGAFFTLCFIFIFFSRRLFEAPENGNMHNELVLCWIAFNYRRHHRRIQRKRKSYPDCRAKYFSALEEKAKPPRISSSYWKRHEPTMGIHNNMCMCI